MAAAPRRRRATYARSSATAQNERVRDLFIIVTAIGFGSSMFVLGRSSVPRCSDELLKRDMELVRARILQR